MNSRGFPEDKISDYGVMERYCPECDEWWPADKEFFYTNDGEGKKLMRTCIACQIEKIRARRRGLVLRTVTGDTPLAGWDELG